MTALCLQDPKPVSYTHLDVYKRQDQNHAPNGDAEVRTSGVWSLWKNIAKQDPSFGHPEKFCSDAVSYTHLIKSGLLYKQAKAGQCDIQ